MSDDKLKSILDRCKCGVFLRVNDHRDYYQTAEQGLDEIQTIRNGDLECTADVRAKMIETDTIVLLQFYPDTPSSSYEIIHCDLDAALDKALECLAAHDKERSA